MASPSHKTTTQPPRSAVVLLLRTALDTSWRAFVPTIGGTLLGVWLDNILMTAPIITTAMITLGFLTSAALIALQIRRVRSHS